MERRRSRQVNPARVYRERERSVHRPCYKQNRHSYISMPEAAENSTFASEDDRPQYSSVRSFPPPPPPAAAARRVYTPLFKPHAEPSLSEEEEEDYQCVAHHVEEERSLSEDELGFPHDYYPVRKCIDTDGVVSPVASFRTQVLCDHCARKTVEGHNSVPKKVKYYSTL